MPLIGVSVVDGGGETPGPIPNPEAKPARADGTAPGREWESRLPPTQQLHTQHPPHNHLCGGCLLLVLHVCGVAHCGQHDRHQQLVCTHKHPVSCGLAHCGQPRPHPSLAGTHEYPYPTKLRIADTSDTANNGCTPTDLPSGRWGFVKADNSVLRRGETASENRPVVNFYENTPPEAHLADAALRTTTPPPRMGAHQRTCRPGSKCLVKPDNTVLRPGETQSENRSLVNFCDTNPAGC